VLTSYRDTVTEHGIPASTLTDGMGVHHPPVRQQGRQQRPRERATPTRRGAEELPPEPPDHLRQGLNGFQQTMTNWLRAQLVQPVAIAELKMKALVRRKRQGILARLQASGDCLPAPPICEEPSLTRVSRVDASDWPLRRARPGGLAAFLAGFLRRLRR
jgi:hypothetical protein